jgi:hypothetical protein
MSICFTASISDILMTSIFKYGELFGGKWVSFPAVVVFPKKGRSK